tara:strand:- start:175 stop:480 length:306 start_codon:yes stop_codon:yes gene_type:complete
MRSFKIFFVILISFLILNSCSDFRKTMTGEKQVTTDEFLIKKKDALVLPPEFEKLPLPNTKKKEDRSSVETILSSSNKTNDNSKNNSALEKMILKELGKNN